MYLVMERIRLQESPPDLDARIQKAMKWLSEVPPLSDQPLGPIGGGCIRHKFFKESKAPFVFPDNATLDQYVNRAYGWLSHRAQQKVSPVSIRGDRVMFTQSDMDDAHFGVDEHGQTVLMHFSAIGLLPATFVAQTLAADAKHRPIAVSLGVAGNPNLASMAAISQCLWMVGDPRLGHDVTLRVFIYAISCPSFLFPFSVTIPLSLSLYLSLYVPFASSN
ncbi:hypothetical protein HYPSUDRAFT_40793 [Hypholoma sublateritium FD-334 SS-4]|uniref:Uncharacterized protein n=1 Tax=Hypholoma sublateritium (strain FD-334 SS-4) TaxID=945553 RepID=A0A0D2NV81_HYPSF|nr:hypothetical protein HYPSUDRAFT_40793 [Hypholoma sublateritium FD-334 SS-4]